MSKSLFFGLRGKLVLLVIAGIVTAFSIIGIIRVYAQEHRIMADVVRSGQDRTSLIAEAVANLLVGYDYTNMESLADRVMNQPDMRKITIRDREDKIMVTREAPAGTDAASQHFETPIMLDNTPIGKVEILLSLERARHEMKVTYISIVLEQIFFGIFLGVLIYFAASRVIVKPVQRIGRHMKTLLQSDEIAPPEQLIVTKHDELGELASIFNNLNRQLYDMQQRLRNKIDLAGSALMATNEQLLLRSSELEQRSRELEETLALVEKLAETDSLTELHNRRYFDVTFSSFFHLAQRYDESLCLVLLDVDHFKQINDQLGHSAGDAVLQTLARLFKSCVRETDTLARLGGDEFAFLLYHTDKGDALTMATKCLELVASHNFEYGGAPLRVSLSIGIASLNEATASVESLYGEADVALYEAKRRGRNQVVAHHV